jgi:hypothetical protein
MIINYDHNTFIVQAIGLLASLGRVSNILAYLSSASLTTKFFITMTPGACTIKLFTCRSKLECFSFSLSINYSSLILAGNARSLPFVWSFTANKVHAFVTVSHLHPSLIFAGKESSSTRVGSSLTPNTRIKVNGCNKHSSLSRYLINDFLSIGS